MHHSVTFESSRTSLIEIKIHLDTEIMIRTQVKVDKFDDISPLQVYRRSVNQGFQFNLLVAGESGLGNFHLSS